ncbi:MAG: hypothetical protein ACOYJ2_04535 [Rickettsiales bacterium]
MALYICKHCGYEGEAKRQKRGSRGVEIFLWSTLLLPGPLYTIWRMTGKSKECPNCERQGFVKSSSDEGYLVKKRFEKELGDVKKSEPQLSNESFGRATSQVEEVKKRQVDPDQF